MKKAILGFVVPTFAIASLVGAGYATWYFNDSTAGDVTTSASIDAEFADIAKLGTFVTTGSIKIVLDEPEDRNHGGLGVHFEEAEEEFSVKYQYDLSTTRDKDISKPVVTWTITKNTPTGNFANYVTVTVIGQGTGTLEADPSGTATDVFTIEDLNNAVTLAYTEEVESVTTYSAYSAMTGNIGDMSNILTISFTAEFPTTDAA